MKRLLIVLMLTAAAVPAAAQVYPSSPPPAGAVRPALFPPFHQERLASGLRLVVVERASAPVVSVALSIPAGQAYDPPGKRGLADLAGLVLPKGAANRTAEQVTAAIESVGGSFSASVDQDFFTLQASALAGGASVAMQLIADAVLRPTFAQEEIELGRTRMLSALQLSITQPAVLANQRVLTALFGEAHPYGSHATPRTIAALTRDDLVALQRTRLVPDGAVLVVTGDITVARARALAQAAFAGWSGRPAALSVPTPPAVRTTGITIVHMPGATQASILVGNIAPGSTDAGRFGATVLSHLLGGSPSSRLFRVLREEKGWTYGASTMLSQPVRGSVFAAGAAVRTEVADSALTELLRQLRHVRDQPVDAAEIARSRDAIVGAFPLTVQTADQVAAQVRTNLLLGRPDSALRTYRTSIAAVTPRDIAAAARTYVRPDFAAIVVVGDADRLRGPLSRIAPVQVVDVEGRAVGDGQVPSSAAAPPPWDLSRLRAGRDSSRVLLQGQDAGHELRAVEMTADGIRLRHDVIIGPIGSQQTEILLTPAGAMRRLVQTGTAQGQQTRIDLTFATGRVTGTSMTPSPQGPQTVDVDQPVPPGAVDDNTFGLLVPALPLRTGARFEVPIIASANGSLSTWIVTVTGEKTVTAPAGTFDVFVVEKTGNSNVTYLVTRQAPYRIVETLSGGGQLRRVLAK